MLSLKELLLPRTSSRQAGAGDSPSSPSSPVLGTSTVTGTLRTVTWGVWRAVTHLHKSSTLSPKGFWIALSLKAAGVLIAVMIKSHLDLNKCGIYCLGF